MTQLHHTVRLTALVGAVVFLTGCVSPAAPKAAVESTEATASQPVTHRSLSMGAGDSIGAGIFAIDSRSETASVRD